eukprot:19241-Heterococcus_DN1.PRE.1
MRQNSLTVLSMLALGLPKPSTALPKYTMNTGKPHDVMQAAIVPKNMSTCAHHHTAQVVKAW